jgi:hypothetical protein
MNSRGIIVGAVAVFTILLLLYFSLNRDAAPRHNWYQSFDQKRDQPYSLTVIKKMLEAAHPGTKTTNEKEPIHKLLAGKKYTKTDYVLMGQSIYLDRQDIDALKGFLADGNNVFIATLEPPDSLLEAIYTNDCETAITYDFDLDSVIHANFYHPRLRKDHDYQFSYSMLPRYAIRP